jgi:hypothetical protein
MWPIVPSLAAATGPSQANARIVMSAAGDMKRSGEELAVWQ